MSIGGLTLLPYAAVLGQAGENWVEVTQGAPWGPRARHASLETQDAAWVLGGSDGETLHNDVWYTEDGRNWNPAGNAAGWTPRENHAPFLRTARSGCWAAMTAAST